MLALGVTPNAKPQRESVCLLVEYRLKSGWYTKKIVLLLQVNPYLERERGIMLIYSCCNANTSLM